MVKTLHKTRVQYISVHLIYEYSVIIDKPSIVNSCESGEIWWGRFLKLVPLYCSKEVVRTKKAPYSLTVARINVLRQSV